MKIFFTAAAVLFFSLNSFAWVDGSYTCSVDGREHTYKLTSVFLSNDETAPYLEVSRGDVKLKGFPTMTSSADGGQRLVLWNGTSGFSIKFTNGVVEAACTRGN